MNVTIKDVNEKKGNVIVVTLKQKDILKDAFKIIPYPDRYPDSLIRMAGDTGLEQEAIKVWFKNRRKKMGSKYAILENDDQEDIIDMKAVKGKKDLREMSEEGENVQEELNDDQNPIEDEPVAASAEENVAPSVSLNEAAVEGEKSAVAPEEDNERSAEAPEDDKKSAVPPEDDENSAVPQEDDEKSAVPHEDDEKSAVPHEDDEKPAEALEDYEKTAKAPEVNEKSAGVGDGMPVLDISFSDVKNEPLTNDGINQTNEDIIESGVSDEDRGSIENNIVDSQIVEDHDESANNDELVSMKNKKAQEMIDEKGNDDAGTAVVEEIENNEPIKCEKVDGGEPHEGGRQETNAIYNKELKESLRNEVVKELAVRVMTNDNKEELKESIKDEEMSIQATNL